MNLHEGRQSFSQLGLHIEPSCGGALGGGGLGGGFFFGFFFFGRGGGGGGGAGAICCCGCSMGDCMTGIDIGCIGV